MLVPVRVPWREKPPPGVPIDFGNPLTKGLINAWALNERAGDPRNLVPGGLVMQNDPTNPVSWAIDGDGVHIHAATAEAHLRSEVNIDPDVDYNIGSFILGLKTTTLTALTNYRYIGAGDNFEARIDNAVGSPIEAEFMTNAVADTVGNRITNNKKFIVGHSWTPSGANHIGRNFFDGRFTHETTATTLAAAAGQLSILSRTTNLTQGFIGNCYFVYQFDRVLSDAEQSALAANPWAIFEPRTIWFPAQQVSSTQQLVPVRIPWTTQPPPGTPLAKNGFTKDLIFACTPNLYGNQQIDLVTGLKGTLSVDLPAEANITPGVPHRNMVAPYGETPTGVGFNDNADIDFGHNDAWDCDTGENSIAVLCEPTGFHNEFNGAYAFGKKTTGGGSVDYGMFAQEVSLGPTFVERLRYRVANVATIDVLKDNAAGNNFNDLLTYFAGSTSSADQSAWAWSSDGSFQSNEGNLGGTVTGGIGEMGLYGRVNENRVFAGWVFLALAWDRYKPKSLHDALRRNPWQIFEPRTVWIPAEIASVVQITDVANAGETPGLGSETWADGSIGNVITGIGFTAV